jgi:hypothetical protein
MLEKRAEAGTKTSDLAPVSAVVEFGLQKQLISF